MQQSSHADDMLHPAVLQELSGARSEAGPVFSLYLDLRADERPLKRFEQLFEQAVQEKKLDQEAPTVRAQWQEEAQRIRSRLESLPAGERQGLAAFFGRAAGLERLYYLPALVTDLLMVKDQPYVRPLEVLLGEFSDLSKGVGGDQERHLEMERVQELLEQGGDNSSGRAVLGLEQTLRAVHGKKVRLLVVEEGYHQAGGECPSCGLLGEGAEGVCLLDGMALRPEPDIIEAAMKRVLDDGGQIEVLRSQQLRHALEPYGRIGALLVEPVEDGQENPQQKRDQAVEESFPASDPPGW